MVITSPYLAEHDRYDRAVDGWVDTPAEDAFRITVRLVDPWMALELIATTTPSPEYGIREAQGRILMGPAGRIDPALGPAMKALAGTAMTTGFTGRVAEITGGRVGGAYMVDAAVEIARLARQVTRVPAAVLERHLAQGPVGRWRLDMVGWADLSGSCYSYRPASERLFAERPVSVPTPAVLYAPPVGTERVFNRTRVVHLERRRDELALSHAMFDEAHSFQVSYLVGADDTIREARAFTPRLPYGGICSDPQARLGTLRGQRVDADLRKRLGVLVGGADGCAQLYDLSADLLRLLTL